MSDEMWDIKQVTQFLALSRSQVYRASDQGMIPKPRKLGPRTFRWSSQELITFVQEKARQRT